MRPSRRDSIRAASSLLAEMRADLERLQRVHDDLAARRAADAEPVGEERPIATVATAAPRPPPLPPSQTDAVRWTDADVDAQIEAERERMQAALESQL